MRLQATASSKLGEPLPPLDEDRAALPEDASHRSQSNLRRHPAAQLRSTLGGAHVNDGNSDAESDSDEMDEGGADAPARGLFSPPSTSGMPKRSPSYLRLSTFAGLEGSFRGRQGFHRSLRPDMRQFMEQQKAGRYAACSV